MRELLYLSERKLRAFHPEPKRRWRGGLRGEVGVPGIAQVGVEVPSGQPTTPSLDEVIDHLTGSVRWYEEEGLTTGQWVQFGADLGYTIAEHRHGPPVLLFAEPHGASTPRLLLHGSPDNLVAGGGVRTSRVSESYPEAIFRVLRGFADAEGVGDDVVDIGLYHLFRYLKRTLPRATTTPLSGYARITLDAADHGVVVASPLVVEFARD